MRRVCRGLMLAWVLGGPAVHAVPLGGVSQEAWTSWNWGVQQDFSLPGARLAQRPFEAGSPPAQAARRLVRQGGMPFDRLMAVNGGIVLSGLREGAHWFGWLRPGPRGTQGILSVLTPASASHAGFDAGVHVPGGARLVARVVQHEGSARVTISGYEHPGEAAGLRAGIAQSLARAGWHSAEATWPGGEAWRRPAAFLQMRLQVHGAHSIIWLWHRKEHP
ncbi:hypothetical protein [Castellaniella sp. GW247-6E4]|uniref:hypothetical protein n=1 Tax=Castellaniella sp. GW247-6E4 TaxID=3140380 RepID=UPI003315A248